MEKNRALGNSRSKQKSYRMTRPNEKSQSGKAKMDAIHLEEPIAGITPHAISMGLPRPCSYAKLIW